MWDGVLKPDANGIVSQILDLADTYGGFAVPASGYDYFTLQIVDIPGADHGSGTILAQASNDGINSVAFGSAISLTAAGVSASTSIVGTAYVVVKIGTVSSSSGNVRAIVKLHTRKEF